MLDRSLCRPSPPGGDTRIGQCGAPTRATARRSPVGSVGHARTYPWFEPGSSQECGAHPNRVATWTQPTRKIIRAKVGLLELEKSSTVIDGIRPRKSGSHQTHRWRKQSRANSSLPGPIPCYTGKIQGISLVLASGTRIGRLNLYYNQSFTSKFPTRRNRELNGL
jgi:hypothetical protein